MTKDPTSENKPGVLDPKANFKALARIVVLLAVVLGGIWLFLRFTAGEKAANKVTSVILRQPIELKNSVENLSASSMKGFALALPYAGTISIEVSVVRGNDIDIYVIPPDQIENAKSKKQFKHFTDFEAKKTRVYRRNGRLAAGNYYLVLFDSTLGVLSAQSSDIQIRAKLEP